MHLGAASARPWEVVPVTRVLDGVGRYSGGITVGEGPICFGKSGRSMMSVPSGGEDRHAGSPEQTLSHS
jgi:hypothetical protein